MESASFHTHKLCTIKFSVGHGDTFAVANHLFCAIFFVIQIVMYIWLVSYHFCSSANTHFKREKRKILE